MAITTAMPAATSPQSMTAHVTAMSDVFKKGPNHGINHCLGSRYFFSFLFVFFFLLCTTNSFLKLD